MEKYIKMCGGIKPPASIIMPKAEKTEKKNTKTNKVMKSPKK